MKITIEASAFKSLEVDPKLFTPVESKDELEDALYEEIEAQDCLSISLDDDDVERFWAAVQAARKDEAT